MSVEQAVIALMVDEGSIKQAWKHGITADDFHEYEEEFQWLMGKAEKKQPINPRIFREKFPDFDWVVPNEKLIDLFNELKQERVFTSLNAAIETVLPELEKDNAVEKASELRDYLTEIVRLHSPVQDIHMMGDWQRHVERAKQLRVIRENGEIAGIPTGFINLDHAYGGWIPGRLITFLGRTGEGKSYTLCYTIAYAVMAGMRVGFFSPEMDEHEHTCRFHTILSANKMIQERTGLKQAFRNRALMEGWGFNIKKYGHFCEYLSSLRGECILFNRSGMGRREKLSINFIESRIEDLGLDMVVIDPLYKMRSPRRRDSKVWELSDLIEEAESLAKGYKIPTIITNQSHRQQGLAARKRAPHKDTSYMSDAITHESDHVIGVRYDAEDHTLNMRCSKSRFGGEFDVMCELYPNVGIMREITQPQGSWYNGTDPTPKEGDEDEVPGVSESAEV